MSLAEILVFKNHEINRSDLRTILLGFLILGFLFYGSTLGNDYNIDDHLAFTSNPAVLNGLSDFQSIFTQNSFHQGDYSFGYRPISTLSFAIEYQLFGIKPLVSHLINILLYSISCFLVFLLVKGIFPTINLKTSLAIGIIFLALPIHAEIANNVKCRDEILMLNFGLISTLLFLKSFGKRSWLVLLAFLSLVCSILSKKTGLVFIGIIPASIFFHDEFSIKRVITRGLIAVASFPFIRIFRKSTKEGINVREYNLIENPLFDSVTEVDQISFTLHSFWFYLTKLLFPTKLVSYYGFNTIQFKGYDFTSFLSVCIIISLVIISLFALKKKGPIAFGAILFLGGMLPIVNLVPLVGIVAERFATLASVGWVIFVVFGLVYITKQLKLNKSKLILKSLFGIFLIASFFMIQNRNQEWKNQFVLFSSDVKKEPNSATLHALIGKQYLIKIEETNNNREKVEIGKIAIKHFEKSAQIAPDNYVLTDLANLYFRAIRDYDLAIKTYLKVIDSKPDYANAYYNLGWVYLEKNEDQKAIANFEKALMLDAKFIEVYEPVVRHFAEKGKFKKALEVNEFGLNEFPNEGIFILNKANIYYLMSEPQNALIWYEKALPYFPNRANIQNKISSLKMANNS